MRIQTSFDHHPGAYGDLQCALADDCLGDPALCLEFGPVKDTVRYVLPGVSLSDVQAMADDINERLAWNDVTPDMYAEAAE